MSDGEAYLDPEIERELDAAWELLDDGDVRGARRRLKSLIETASNVPEVFELEAEVALADEDPETALDAYGRWSEIDPDDPEPWLGSAEVYMEYYEDAAEAARILRELLAGPSLEPEEEADARHLLGLACEEKNDRRGMIKEWLAVLRLDAATDQEPMFSRRKFERFAAAALDELPDEVLAYLGNVPVFVEDRPSEALVLEGLDPRTLGLFHGIAMPDQSVLSGGGNALIHLFQRNLEREAEDEDDLAEQIRITVLHETAHYFGASEDDLKGFGLN